MKEPVQVEKEIEKRALERKISSPGAPEGRSAARGRKNVHLLRVLDNKNEHHRLSQAEHALVAIAHLLRRKLPSNFLALAKEYLAAPVWRKAPLPPSL